MDIQRVRGKLPGLLQIHGGGQYADSNAALTNAKRGYATLSIAWAGRVSAPQYRVTPNEVKLFLGWKKPKTPSINSPRIGGRWMLTMHQAGMVKMLFLRFR